jgi:hypothetical protein
MLPFLSQTPVLTRSLITCAAYSASRCVCELCHQGIDGVSDPYGDDLAAMASDLADPVLQAKLCVSFDATEPGACKLE